MVAPLAEVAPEPLETVMVSGSSSKVPVFPLAAEVSTEPSKNSYSFHEASTDPPSPKYLHPRPLTIPGKSILRSAQKMVLPPSP